MAQLLTDDQELPCTHDVAEPSGGANNTHACACGAVCYVVCTHCNAVCRAQRNPEFFTPPPTRQYRVACKYCRDVYCAHCANLSFTDDGTVCAECSQVQRAETAAKSPFQWFIVYNFTFVDRDARPYCRMLSHPRRFDTVADAYKECPLYLKTLLANQSCSVEICDKLCAATLAAIASSKPSDPYASNSHAISVCQIDEREEVVRLTLFFLPSLSPASAVTWTNK